MLTGLGLGTWRTVGPPLWAVRSTPLHCGLVAPECFQLQGATLTFLCLLGL